MKIEIKEFVDELKELLEMERTDDNPDETYKLGRLAGVQATLYHLSQLSKKHRIDSSETIQNTKDYHPILEWAK